MEKILNINAPAEAQEALKNFTNLRTAEGKTVDLGEWVTIKKYCQKFNIPNVETVLNWINRGRIPADCIQIIEELNGLRLIKAISYK